MAVSYRNYNLILTLTIVNPIDFNLVIVSKTKKISFVLRHNPKPYWVVNPGLWCDSPIICIPIQLTTFYYSLTIGSGTYHTFRRF